MPETTDTNPNSLRVIKTARTLRKINSAAHVGFWPLVKPVIPSPQIQDIVAVFQHNITGKITLSSDLRHRFDDNFTCVMDYTAFYPYHFPEPYAAYLIPKDLKEGEHVWIEDVIEDIVAIFGNQGYSPRLDACEAVWQNGDFLILFDPEKDAPVWLG